MHCVDLHELINILSINHTGVLEAQLRDLREATRSAALLVLCPISDSILTAPKIPEEVFHEAGLPPTFKG